MRYKVWERQKIVSGLRSPQVTSVEKFVIMALNEHADADGGNCFPSTTTLAEETILSRQTVSKALKSLEAKGLIKVTPRFRNNAQVSNNYKLMYSKMLAPCKPALHPPVNESDTPCKSPLHPLSTRATPPVNESDTDPISFNRSQLTDPSNRSDAEDERSFEEWLKVKFSNDPSVRSPTALIKHVLAKGKDCPEYRDWQSEVNPDPIDLSLYAHLIES